VLFSTVGACLGWPSRKPLTGAIGAALIGCVATLGFYLLQAAQGYSAMFLLFVALWIALGVMTGRVLQRNDGHQRCPRQERACRRRALDSASTQFQGSGSRSIHTAGTLTRVISRAGHRVPAGRSRRLLVRRSRA